MTQESEKVKRKDASKTKNEPKADETVKDENKKVKPKYGPMLTFPYQRIWSRCMLILGILIIVWYNSRSGKEVPLALQKEILLSRSQNVECSEDYRNELSRYPGCAPERCGRFVSDKLVSASEAEVLLKIVKAVMKLGGPPGCVSVLDLHTGALSRGTAFVDVYKLEEAKKIFNTADFAIYKVVKTKIQHAIAHNFGLNADRLYLTKPTFFSRMTNITAKTIHDEYWHPHVDKDTYKSFYFTSLLYLSDYGRDFEGGRFIFLDSNNVNATIEPRKGRVSMFTSGRENRHVVEKVTSGMRYALTVSFTCEPDYSVSDPGYGKVTRVLEGYSHK